MRSLILLAGGAALLISGCATGVTSSLLSTEPPRRGLLQSPLPAPQLLGVDLSPGGAWTGDPFIVCWHPSEITPDQPAAPALSSSALPLIRRPLPRTDHSPRQEPAELAQSLSLRVSPVATIELGTSPSSDPFGGETVSRILLPRNRPADPSSRPSDAPIFTPYHWSSYTRIRQAAHRAPWHFRWDRLYFEEDGEPLQAMHIGAGDTRTLVLGSLHGDELTAPELVERLARSVSNHSDNWPLLSTLFIRSGNPNGLWRRTAANARGVDLNRNFPTADYQPNPAQGAGDSAASEPETRTLIAILQNFRPARIVHVKVTPRPDVWVLCNLQARDLATTLAHDRSVRVGPLDERSLPGSIEAYASAELGLQAVTIGVPYELRPAEAWERTRQTLWTCLLAPE